MAQIEERKMAAPMFSVARNFCSIKCLKLSFLATLPRLVANNFQRIDSHHINKAKFSTSGALELRKVVSTVKDNVTVVEGEVVESGRAPYIVPALKEAQHKGACPLCRLNLKISYTDVLILSQFIDPTGKILPQAVTGLCIKQHRHVEFLIDRSKKAGLLPRISSSGKMRPVNRKYKVYYSNGRQQKIPVYHE